MFEIFIWIYRNYFAKTVFYQKDFPNISLRKDLIGKSFTLPGIDKLFFTMFYHSKSLMRRSHSWYDHQFQSLEIFPLFKKADVFINFNLDSESIVPIAIVNDQYDSQESTQFSIKLQTDKEVINLHKFVQNRYHHIRLPKGNYHLESQNEINLGTPIPLTQAQAVKKVIVLYVDGLTSEVFKYVKFDKLMPYTFQFFKEGLVIPEVSSNSTWTLASLPILFTGKYQVNHKIFHPYQKQYLPNNFLTISEIFQNENYLTSSIGGSPRMSPTYGYARGFDRILYQRYMDTAQVINSTIEQLEAFKDRSQFIWSTLFDLNHEIYQVPDLFSSSQLTVLDHQHKFKEGKNKSNNSDINHYLAKVRQLDFSLNQFYSYINSNHSKENFTIVLCSDYGHSFFENIKNYPFQSGVTDINSTVPFMILNSKISHHTVLKKTEFFSNVDVLPTLLDLLEIKIDQKNLDGVAYNFLEDKFNKEYKICELKMLGKPYCCVLTGKKHQLIFKSKKKILNDGSFEKLEYDLNFVNKENGEISLDQNEKEKYLKLLLLHINL